MMIRLLPEARLILLTPGISLELSSTAALLWFMVTDIGRYLTWLVFRAVYKWLVWRDTEDITRVMGQFLGTQRR